MRAARVLIVILAAACSLAQEKADRYGVALDAKAYPQATAKEALSSVLKAVADKKVDYVVAHLADPSFVDDRVKRVYGGKFAEQVDETRARLDPFALKQLKRFVDEGKWSEGKAEATVTLDDSKERRVKLVKKGDRWYLANAWGK
jgi:hypothetical protein